MVGRVLSIYTTAAMTTAIADMSTFGWVTQTLDEHGRVRHRPGDVRHRGANDRAHLLGPRAATHRRRLRSS